jgi:hypothetical protein
MIQVYSGLALILFLVFAALHVFLRSKLKGGFIERKASWFLLGYSLVFLLKATVFTLKLFPVFNQLVFLNFLLVLAISLATDIVTFLLYTFILEMREAMVKLASTSHQQYLASQVTHRKVQAAIYSLFFIIKGVL